MTPSNQQHPSMSGKGVEEAPVRTTDMGKEQLREELEALYNESRKMGMLRVGSPVDYMVEGAMQLFESELATRIEAAREDELRRIYTEARFDSELTSFESDRITGYIDARLATLTNKSTNKEVE